MRTASQRSNQNKMETAAVPRLVISMAVPFMLSLLIHNLYNVVDSIFVSRISETALAATSLAYPIQVLAINPAHPSVTSCQVAEKSPVYHGSATSSPARSV